MAALASNDGLFEEGEQTGTMFAGEKFSGTWCLHASSIPAMSDNEWFALSRQFDATPDRSGMADPNRQERVWAHAMKTAILARAVGKPPLSLKFYSGPAGKPFLDQGPHFNLSHSARKVLLLWGGREMGVDLQAHRPVIHVETIARTMWPPALGDTPLSSAIDFFERWTLAEALGKALGCGLSGLRDEAASTEIVATSRGRALAFRGLIAFNVQVWSGFSAAVCGAARDTPRKGSLPHLDMFFWTPRGARA